MLSWQALGGHGDLMDDLISVEAMLRIKSVTSRAEKRFAEMEKQDAKPDEGRIEVGKQKETP
jgi:hypothetical protein